MTTSQLSQRHITAAYAIAIVADLVQLPLTAMTATGILAIPGEFVDFMIDCLVMLLTSILLGFHWLLLPSLFIEVVPGLEMFPTWTGCVACVVRMRRNELARSSAASYETEQESGDSTAHAVPLVVPPLPPRKDAAVQKRLRNLLALFEKNLISQEEYDAKRQQILAEL